MSIDMANFAKTIEGRFASSVKSRVQICCTAERTRGSPRQSIRASLHIDRRMVLRTHGTIACTGLLQTRGDDGCDEHAQHLIEDRRFYEALTRYEDLSIDEALNSNNCIVRAFAMLDARLGKHRLSKINVKHEPDLVQNLFWLRCQCEGLPVVQSTHTITTRVQPKYTTVTNEPDREAQSAQILSQRKRGQNVRTLLDVLERGNTLNAADGPIAKALIESLKGKKIELRMHDFSKPY